MRETGRRAKLLAPLSPCGRGVGGEGWSAPTREVLTPHPAFGRSLPQGERAKNRLALLLPLLFALSSPAFAEEPDAPADPAVTPAQFTQPADPRPATGTAPPPTGVVADPPSPTVRIQVRVPSHVAPGKEIAYKLLVVNTSAADAYRVAVRDPLPPGVAGFQADPKPDKAEVPQGAQVPKELVWTLGTLRAGEKREIELSLRPSPETKEIRNQAFVSFEHGEAVVTKVDKPKLAVKKTAPKQVANTDPIPVRVEVTNTGRVPVAAVELVEDVSKGFEFDRDDDGEKGSSPQQRLWKLGSLRPGERKVIDYKLTAKDGAELLASSVVKSQDTPDGERAESSTKVLTPALALDLTGPPSVPAGEAALYEVVARNTGTLPLTDVRVTASVPADCTMAKMTNGGSRYRDQVVWTVPQLKPGEAQSYRLGLKAATTGRRTVRASARDARGLEKAREVVTTFEGSALLDMKAVPDPVAITVGREGLLTVRVTNHGGETARNVRLRAELPPEVKFVQATPRNQAAANEVAFEATTVAAGGTETFTLTYKANQSGQAWFRLKLAADSLGDQPLTKEQAVEISGGK